MTWSAAHREGSIAANYLLSDLGLDRDRWIDVFDVLHEQGIVAARRPMPRLAGAYIPGGTASTTGVLVNSNHPTSKQRYTAAHELGHHHLGHGTCFDPETDVVEQWGNGPLPQREKAAEAFASWFLMPQPLVRGTLDRLALSSHDPLDVYALSLRIGASYRATVQRLQTLQFISVGQARALARVRPATLKRQLAGRWHPRDSRADVWRIGERDAGFPIVVEPDDLVIITVEEVPSTGYAWEVESPGALEPIGNDLVASDDDMPGGGATRQFAYSVSSVNDRHNVALSLRHQRGWGDPADDAQTLLFDIAIHPFITGIDARHLVAAAA